ncbi:MAG: RNA 3'-terminal phosphate cyclase [Pseudomonadota bacterium]
MSEPVVLNQAGAGRNQALRTALALAAVTGRRLVCRGLVDDNPRPRPGLGLGGLSAVAATAVVSGGSFRADLGQSELEIRPAAIRPGEYAFDVAHQRANAAPLAWLLEPLVLPLALAGQESSLFLAGGTHVLGGPTSEFVSRVLAPDLGLMGLLLEYIEIAPGFYPAGGGEAEARIEAAGSLRALQAEGPFEPLRVGVDLVSTGLPVHLAEQALAGAQDRLGLHELKAETRLRRARGGTGLALLVWAEDASGLRVGFPAIGHRGGRPEGLAIEAVEALIAFLDSQAGLPSGQAAMLLAAMACARGVSRLTVPGLGRELRAAAAAVEAFWPETVQMFEDPRGGPAMLRVIGRDFGRAV